MTELRNEVITIVLVRDKLPMVLGSETFVHVIQKMSHMQEEAQKP